MNRESRTRNPEELDFYLKADHIGIDLAEEEDKIGFIRKVYGILFFQLAITAGVTLIPYLNEDVKIMMLQNQWLLMGALITSIVISCCMFCVHSLGRVVPMNYILMTVFTICEAYIVAFICAAVNNPRIVLAAAFMTMAIVAALTIYSLTTTTDFTMMGGLAFIVGAIFIVLGLFSYFFGPKLYLIYCSLGVLLFGFYLIIDT